MKKFLIVILIIEILLSIVVICLKESIIIGNYGEDSSIYKIIDSERQLPENANIKYIIKNRFIFRDATYEVYYKTDKMNSIIISFELNDARIKQLDSRSTGTWIYCIIIIGLTIFIFYIINSITRKEEKVDNKKTS